MDNYKNYDIGEVRTAESVNSYVAKVYGMMFLGLILSAISAWTVAAIPTLYNMLLGSFVPLIVLVVVEFSLVIAISRVDKMTTPMSMLLFALFAIVNGVTLSSIFLTFEIGMITMAFVTTAATFGIMGIYGYFTKTDLTKFGNLAIFFIVGGIVASILNIFLGSSTLDLVITIVMLAVFIGLVAFDTQKIKSYFVSSEGAEINGTNSLRGNLAVYSALALYLDFVNIFLYMLQLFSRSRD